MIDNLSIRRVCSVQGSQELKDIQRLHKKIWGVQDVDVVAGHLLVAISRNAGLLLCAYDGDKPIGFSLGICAVQNGGSPYFYSHNLGVLKEYWDSDIGYQIKLAQRKYVLSMSLLLAQWTFDPLESRNAYLNIKKLGCICARYIHNHYGTMSDGLNANLPSDRMIAEWWINSDRVVNAVDSGPSHTPLHEKNTHAEIEPLNNVIHDDWELPKPLSTATNWSNMEAGHAYVEIPYNYQQLRQRDIGLAREWRFHVREILEECFARNMVIDDFVCRDQRSFYGLRMAENRIPEQNGHMLNVESVWA